MWEVINKRAQLIKEPNEVRVLRLIRDGGQISRTEISEQCNLSKASVSEIVLELIESGFVEETGKGDSTERGGRKRILLQFKPSAGLVAGIEIRIDYAVVALADLNASVLQQETFSFAVGSKPDDVLPHAVSLLDDLLKKYQRPNSRLIGIGVGLPGLVEYKSNTLRVADTLKGWQSAQLAAALETHFNVPVYLENDVKAMTLGEYLFGAGKGSDTLVHIWIGEGIGAGLIVNGTLHRGITSSAGEIGYNDLGYSIHSTGRFPLLYNGQRDFGEILSDRNLIESYCRSSRTNEKYSVEMIINKALNGEQLAQQLLEEFASLISIVCINMINALNPEIILVGGKVAQFGDYVIAKVQDKVRADLLTLPAEVVKVRSAQLGKSATILGAIGLILYELFEPLHSLSLRSNTMRHHAIVED